MEQHLNRGTQEAKKFIFRKEVTQFDNSINLPFLMYQMPICELNRSQMNPHLKNGEFLSCSI